MATDQLGLITLPNVNGGGNPRPVIQNSPGAGAAAITLPTTGNAEVSNFAINNPGYTGIVGPNTSGVMNINRTTVSGGPRGIEFDAASGTANLTAVSLTDQTNLSFFVYGGSLDVNVDTTSQITQGAGGRALEVGVHHTGDVTFDGTLAATSGDGMFFGDADGTYRFNGPVTLNGGDAHIYVGGGTGRLTFANATIINRQH